MASDADDSSDSDYEALESIRRACLFTNTDPSIAPDADTDEDEDDFELVRTIRQRFKAKCSGKEGDDEDNPLTLKPLNVLLPVEEEDDGDDSEDDFAILKRIQKRFSCYDQDADGLENSKEKKEQGSKRTYPKKGASSSVEREKTNAQTAVPDTFDMHNVSGTSETLDTATPDTFPSSLTDANETDTHDLVMVEGCGFPEAAQTFVEAIRKNRACQKFIRNKMMQIEGRIEENKKLQHRVKVLRGFQIKCKKQTTRELSQQQDARIQLISASKPKRKQKTNGKKDSASCHGPAENSHVASYRMVLSEHRISLNRRKWTDEERQNLAKGIKQQFQELLLLRSVDSISEMVGDSDEVDSLYASIKEHDITSEDMRLFIPKVNWERLASMYVKGRSGAECEARWLNWEDPLINHKPWTRSEEKKLLQIVQKRGISNWIEIAVLLETNRTPFQCLARYQRSLNASVIRSEWSKEEDEKLCAAVMALGESNWENVAATLVGRTGPQCSNRWMKSLNPARERTGRWSADEDKRVKVAVAFFGKNWIKVAQSVPGRTHVQCRERWANNLDPSLKLGLWSEEEDLKLKAAIEEHGYCWTKVAACVPSRTDNQCTRRWKTLFPHEVRPLQAARKMQRAALISNFVDRKSERPALGLDDFVPLLINADPESGESNQSGKQKRKPRSKRATKKTQFCSDEVSGIDGENVAGGKTSSKKNLRPRRCKNRKGSEATEDARVGEEILHLDVETKKIKAPRKEKTLRELMMALRSKKAAKRAPIVTTGNLLTNSVDVEEVAGERTNSKKKLTPRQLKKTNYASEATEGARVGEEIVPFEVEPKKKKAPMKSKLVLRGRLKKTNTEANSHVSTCGHSEVFNGDNVRANSRRSSVNKKNNRCKRYDEAASSFGENEASSEARRISSPNLCQDADPTEVNSSPCPNLKSRSQSIRNSTLLHEVSNITEISDSETLGSIMLKKRDMKRNLKKSSAQVHSSPMIQEVDTIEEGARDNSCSRRKRRSRKPKPRESDNIKLGNKRKRLSIDKQLARGHDIGGERGDDSTLASLFKNGRKKRKISLSPKTPPLVESCVEPPRIGWL